MHFDIYFSCWIMYSGFQCWWDFNVFLCARDCDVNPYEIHSAWHLAASPSYVRAEVINSSQYFLFDCQLFGKQRGRSVCSMLLFAGIIMVIAASCWSNWVLKQTDTFHRWWELNRAGSRKSPWGRTLDRHWPWLKRIHAPFIEWQEEHLM